METYGKTHKYLCGFIFAICLLSCAVCDAMRGGGGGVHRGGDNFNRGGDLNRGDFNHRDYNRDNWDNAGAVVVPEGGYVTSPGSCSTVQQCDSDGNCVQNQVCN